MTSSFEFYTFYCLSFKTQHIPTGHYSTFTKEETTNENLSDNLVIIEEGVDSNNNINYKFPCSQRKDTPVFKIYLDDQNQNLLEKCLEKDIWSLANFLPTSEHEDLPLLGLWTAFNSMICNANYSISTIENMPVSGEPPNHAACKNYLDGLKEIAKDLDLDHIFAHADEDVHSKLTHIIWKHGDLYKEVIIIVDDFHVRRV